MTTTPDKKYCPVCGSVVHHPPIHGVGDNYETWNYYCRICNREYRTEAVLSERPQYPERPRGSKHEQSPIRVFYSFEDDLIKIYVRPNHDGPLTKAGHSIILADSHGPLPIPGTDWMLNIRITTKYKRGK